MKERASNKLTYNILQLQNLIKRNPSSYYDEFCVQYEYFQSLFKLYMMKPQNYNQGLADLIMFLAQVSSCYKEDLKEYPEKLMNVLKQHYSILDPNMRMCFCKALILMRNRGIIDAIDLITLFFILLRSKDKILRKHLQVHIITDIKNMNKKHKNLKLNSALQNFIHKMLSDNNTTAAKMSLDIMIELYQKNVWKDAKTVNSISTACFSKVNKILVTAHQFFLSVNEDEEVKESSDSEDDTPTVKEVMTANKVNKKSRRRMKILKRTKHVLKKSKKKKKNEVFDFSAIHLLHDPQGMAEKLLKMLNELNERYEIKMMIMNLISRLVGIHQLILLNFYALLIRFIKPHQRDVTRILMFAAQAAHEYVPPDAIEPVVKTIANNFITERNSNEVITVGINAIREICVRCPLAISQDLLQDIVQYKKYKNKNVMMAARSLIQLFRRINPHMLQRKYRSRPTEASKELNSLEYGALNAKSYIPGSEVLSVEPLNEDSTVHTDDDGSSESDGSWIDVSHSEDEMQFNEEENAAYSDEVKTDDCDTDGSATDNEVIQHSEGAETGYSSEMCESRNKNSINKQLQSIEKNVRKSKGEKTSMEQSSSSKTQEKEKAIIISQSRILSQEEFKKLKAAQISKEITFLKGKKRMAESLETEVDIKRNEIVSLKDIEKLHKKPKPDKESRLSTVLEGREGREKFGKKKKKNPFSSKTQKMKNKNKAFMMIKHKVRAKQKRSFKDKQIALRNALLKCRRQK